MTKKKTTRHVIGDVYAKIREWQLDTYPNGAYPFVRGIIFSNEGSKGRNPLFDISKNKTEDIWVYWEDESNGLLEISAPEPGLEIKAPKSLENFFSNNFYNSYYNLSRGICYLDVSHLDVSKTTNFQGCFREFGTFERSEIVGLSNWDVSNGKNFAGMFFKAFPHSSDVCLDLSSWKFSKACRSTLYGLFEDFAEKASKVELKLDWDTSNVTRFKKMFNGFAPMAEDVKIVGIENWAVGQAECFYDMFKNFAQKSNCKLDLTSWSKDHPLLADHYSFSENLFFRIKEPAWVN